MAEYIATFRAIADFSSLDRAARRAKLSLAALQREATLTNARAALSPEVPRSYGEYVDELEKAVIASKEEENAAGDMARADLKAAAAADVSGSAADNAAGQVRDLAAAHIADAVAADRAAANEHELARAHLEEAAAADVAAVAGAGGPGSRGGPPLKTDIGESFKFAQTSAKGFLAALLLISPTVSLIAAALVGVISLLASAAIAAVAFGAAFLGVGAAILFTFYKWRDLIDSTNKGATAFQQAFLAIEAAAFNAGKAILANLGGPGTDLWGSLATAAITAINAIAPYIQKFLSWLTDLANALSGQSAAGNAFIDWMKGWLDEWKKLRVLVGQGVDPNAPGLFTRLQEAGKAVVEALAKIIAAIRRLAQSGLGLTMGQLTELITKFGNVLVALIPAIAKFSSALNIVALALVRALNELTPFIVQAITFGAAILQHIVGPLLVLAAAITSKILSLPIVGFLAALAAGFAVAAFGIAKLSFGLIKFGDIMSGKALGALILFIKNLRAYIAYTGVAQGLAIGFPKIAKVVEPVVGALQGIGASAGVEGGVAAGFAGAGIAAVAVAPFVIASWVAWNRLLAENARRQRETAAAADATRKSLAAGAISINEARKQFESDYTRINEAHLTPFSPVVPGVGVQRGGLGQGMTVGEDPNAPLRQAQQTRALAYANEQLAKSSNAVVKNSVKEIETNGILTESQVRYLKILQDGEGTRQYFRNFLSQTEQDYKDNIITTAQYISILQQLGIQYDVNGNKIDLYGLAVQGVSQTLAEAVVRVQDFMKAVAASGALKGFAKAIGDDFISMASDVKDAFTNVQGGLLISGEKVNELFLKQQEAIKKWKVDVADSFNAVKNAFSDLAGQGALSFKDIHDALAQGVQDILAYTANFDRLKRLGASKQVLTQLKDLGIEGAPIAAGLVEGGRSGIAQINDLVRQGGELARGLANDIAGALDVTFKHFLTNVEALVSYLTGVALPDIKQGVKDALAEVGTGTAATVAGAARTVATTVTTTATTMARSVQTAFNKAVPFVHTELQVGQPQPGPVQTAFNKLVPFVRTALKVDPPTAAEVQTIFHRYVPFVRVGVIADQPTVTTSPAQPPGGAGPTLTEAAVIASRSAAANANKDLTAATDVLTTASKSLASAQQQEAAAQQSLTDARVQAKYALQDLRIAAVQAQLNEKSSILDLFDARKALHDLSTSSQPVTYEDYKRARIAVWEAELSVKDAKHQNARTSDELTAAEKKGIKGSDVYQQALQQLASAHDAVVTASDAVQQAMKDQSAALKKQADAVDYASRIQERYNRQVQAQAALDAAAQAAQEDRTKAVLAHQAAQDDLNNSFALTPTEVKTVLTIDTTKAEADFDALVKKANEQGILIKAPGPVTPADRSHQQLHEGGLVGDAKGSTHKGPLRSNEVPIVALKDEFVVNPQDSKKHSKLLETINSGRMAYHEGGRVVRSLLKRGAEYLHEGGVVGSARAYSDTLDKLRASGVAKVRFLAPAAPAAPGAPGQPVDLTIVQGVPAGTAGIGTPAMNAMNSWIHKNFRLTGSNPPLGTDRQIGTTGVVSQHAYGNAGDYFGQDSEMSRLMLTLVKMANSRTIRNLGHVIHMLSGVPSVWSWNNQSIHTYAVPPGGSDHAGHTHVDMLPQFAGAMPGYPVPPASYRKGGYVEHDQEARLHRGETVVNSWATALLGADNLVNLNDRARVDPNAAFIGFSDQFTEDVMGSSGEARDRALSPGRSDSMDLAIQIDGVTVARSIALAERHNRVLLAGRGRTR